MTVAFDMIFLCSVLELSKDAATAPISRNSALLSYPLGTLTATFTERDARKGLRPTNMNVRYHFDVRPRRRNEQVENL